MFAPSKPPKPQCVDRSGASADTTTQINKLTGSIQQGLSSVYSSIKPYMSTGYEKINNFTFTTSNKMVDIVVFIFLLLIILVVLIKTIFSLLPMPKTPKKEVLLLNGFVDASMAVTIPQNAATHPELFASPSNNQPGGLEFTWSVWIYITTLDASNSYSNVFFKGHNRGGTYCNNINNMLNAPGVYIKTENNSVNLFVFMDTYTLPSAVYYPNQPEGDKCIKSNSVQIPHIPVMEWVNVCITCQERSMSVYVNGLVSSTLVLDGIPKQNNGDVCICYNGGFIGRVSTLKYFTRKLSVLEINNIVKHKPINQPASKTPKSLTNSVSDVLSFRWYTA